jgi:hypothetical protein
MTERYDSRDNPASRVREHKDDSEALLDETARELKGEAPWSRSATDAAYRKRMHRALDDLLDRIEARRRCAGDRQFLRGCGVKP